MSRRDRSGERAIPTATTPAATTPPPRPLALRLTMVVVLVVPLLLAGVAAIAGRSTASVALAASPLDTEPVRAAFESTGGPRGTVGDEVESTSSTSTSTTAKATTSTTAKATTSTTAKPAATSTSTTSAKPTTTTTTAPAPAPVPTKPQSVAPAPPPTTPAPAVKAAPSVGSGNEAAILACIRRRESGGNYAINTGNGYYGAYQFHQGTWDSVARSVGRLDLVGVRPSSASPADQDALALALLRSSGLGPWGGRCP